MIYKIIDKNFDKNIVGIEKLSTFAASKTTRSGLFV